MLFVDLIVRLFFREVTRLPCSSSSVISLSSSLIHSNQRAGTVFKMRPQMREKAPIPAQIRFYSQLRGTARM